MNLDQLIGQAQELREIIELAERMDAVDHYGGLHIVVADGNCDDESVEFCLEQTEKPLTSEERELAQDLQVQEEEARFVAYWLSDRLELANALKASLK